MPEGTAIFIGLEDKLVSVIFLNAALLHALMLYVVGLPDVPVYGKLAVVEL